MIKPATIALSIIAAGATLSYGAGVVAQTQSLASINATENRAHRYGELPPGVIAHGDDLGGNLMEAFARYFPAPGQALAFTGTCGSSCTILADQLARQGRACITPRMVMLFHAASAVVDGRTQWLKGTETAYRPAVAAWVLAHGGFPATADARRATVMPYRAALAFWPDCTEWRGDRPVNGWWPG